MSDTAVVPPAAPPAPPPSPASAAPPEQPSPDPTQAAPVQRPEAAEPPRAPMAVLLERLEQAAPFVSVKDPALKDRIGWLVDEAAAAPAALDRAWFKTRVAYVVQDLERSNGARLVMDPALRAELDKLALSSPGLRHDRLAALMRETAELRPEDGALVQDIRRMARQAVAGGLDVAGPESRERIDGLEERVRAARAGEPAPTTAAITPDPAPKADPAAKVDPTTAAQARATSDAFAAPAPAPVSSTPADPPRDGPQAAQPAPSARPPQSHPAAPVQTTVTAQRVSFRGSLRDILASTRSPEPATPPPWANEPAPLTGRLGEFEQRRADWHSDRLVADAERAAQGATRALEALGNGPGTGVLKKIEQAAVGDPDGMRGVLSGMQPGGKYADLRAEFNATMTAERAFASAYDKVAASAGQYATARQAVDADFARRGLDAARLEGRFEAMDKAIGEGTAKLPGRESGKGLHQELAQKAAEFFQRVMERVRASLSTEAKPGLAAAPVPAPSPGMAP